MVKKIFIIICAFMLAGMPASSHAKTDMKSYKIKRLVSQLYNRKTVMDAQRQLLSYGDEVTEYLIPVLKDKSSEKSVERARITALRIIASVGDSRAEDDVVKLLSDKDFRVRQEAARALSVIATKKSSVEPLKSLLTNDTNANVRLNAIKALVKLAPGEETDLFIKTLGDRDPRIRRFAVIALGNIKSVRAIPALSQLVSDPDANVRLELARALVKIDNEACLPFLEDLVRDPHPNIRMVAVEGVSQLELKGTEEILVEAAESSDGRVASLAIIALADRKSGRTLEAARKRFNDERLAVRMAAIEAVGKVGGEAEKPLLKSLLKSESSRVRNKAEEALVSVRCNMIKMMKPGERKGAEDSLIVMLDDDDPRVRVAAIIALGNLKSVEAVPALSHLVDDSDLNVRVKLTGALANIGSESCLKPLVQLMGDKNEEVRNLAAKELSRTKTAGVENILAEAAKGKNSRISSEAMRVLMERRSVKALEIAKERLKDKKESVRLVAIGIIGKMGGEEEKPLLRSLAGSDSSDVRKSAKEALKEVNSRI